MFRMVTKGGLRRKFNSRRQLVDKRDRRQHTKELLANCNIHCPPSPTQNSISILSTSTRLFYIGINCLRIEKERFRSDFNICDSLQIADGKYSSCLIRRTETVDLIELLTFLASWKTAVSASWLAPVPIWGGNIELIANMTFTRWIFGMLLLISGPVEPSPTIGIVSG